jgi:hypothetical protein
LIATTSIKYLLAGMGITLVIIALRYISATAIGHLLGFTKVELVISRLSFPLGTSALVFSQLPLLYDPQRIAVTNPEIYTYIVFPIVMATLIYTSLATAIIGKRQLISRPKTKKKEAEAKD